MEKIQFDTGQRSYHINGAGILRFNPLDPNVYERFMEAADKLQKIEEELVQEAQGLDPNGIAALGLLKAADVKAKNMLNYVFGAGNDFDAMLNGINLMAVASNGERVITNLLQALTPILESGARDCAASFTQKA